MYDMIHIILLLFVLCGRAVHGGRSGITENSAVFCQSERQFQLVTEMMMMMMMLLLLAGKILPLSCVLWAMQNSGNSSSSKSSSAVK